MADRAPDSLRYRLVAAAAAVAVVVGLAVILVRTDHAAPPSSTGYVTAPARFVLPSLDGGPDVRLDQFRGHPLVVAFFASWCDSCRAELPLMASAASQLRGRVSFLGVDSMETGDGLAMARQAGIGGWPLARDVGGNDQSGLHDAVSSRFDGMPVTAYYDAAGHLLDVTDGEVTAPELRSALQRLYGVTPAVDAAGSTVG